MIRTILYNIYDNMYKLYFCNRSVSTTSTNTFPKSIKYYFAILFPKVSSEHIINQSVQVIFSLPSQLSLRLTRVT